MDDAAYSIRQYVAALSRLLLDFDGGEFCRCDDCRVDTHYYILGLFLMAVIYGLYYYIYTGDKKWIYGVLFATFYTRVSKLAFAC